MNVEHLEMGFTMQMPEDRRARRRWQRAAIVAGLLITAPFILWFLLGLLGLVPSIVQVFGPAELRTPASIVVAGLLIAALGFWDY